MIYQLRDCATGAIDDEIKTYLEITEKEGVLTFVFTAENSGYHCPFKNYNDIHTKGDACEILIGSDLEKKVYYELEVSAQNGLMICKMKYRGEEKGEIFLDMEFVEIPFVTSSVLLRDGGYVATISFPIEKIFKTW